MSPEATRLAEQIIGAILGGRLSPGTRLDPPGADLSTALLDAALAQVCASGLAERHPDGGIRVAAQDPTLLLDRFEALGEIAALCARLAARRAPVEDMRSLDDLVNRMEDTDPLTFRQMCLDLHDQICRMTKNAELCRVCADLRSRLHPVWPIWPDQADHRQRCRHEHRALVEAICARDEDQAAIIMRGHLRAISREVLFTAGLCPTDPV